MKVFDQERIEAVKVVFLAPIFEEEFTERGMKAYFTKIERDAKSDCYKLYFDLEEFFGENKKYFTACYWDKERSPTLTAIEAGYYPTNHKYSVYFGDASWSEEKLEEELSKYLKILEN